MSDNGYWKGQTDAKVDSLEGRVQRIDENVSVILESIADLRVKVAGIAVSAALITSLVVAWLTK